MQYWFDQFAEIKERKYPEQIAYFKENHAFSQVHANALVLYCRGSKTSRRYNTFDDYLNTITDVQAETLRAVFKTLMAAHKDFEIVIAWNQPMLKLGSRYLFGASAGANHLMLAPFDSEILDVVRPRLEGYKVNKKTFQIPNDWKVDKKLLRDMIDMALAKE